ncbi:hypothetical protein HDU67_009394 [Dinochytrium kinnereticum]|nr:hypothetical protein HDU67_009394 [Dinochytrium kinnereticum]
MRFTAIASTIGLLASSALLVTFLPFRLLFSLFFSTVKASAAACTKGKYFDKLLMIVLENEDAQNVENDIFLGTTLASQGYSMTNLFGVAHPSQPNYIAMLAGDTLGVTTGGTVNLAQRNLVDLLEAKGLSWKTYQEDYPGRCSTGASYSNGLYARKHNPFISFTNIARNSTRCAKIVPATQFDSDLAAGTLPNYMFYTPNMKNDGHDTGLAYGSNWTKGFLEGKLGHPNLKDTLIMVVFDESATLTGPNKIYGVFLGAGILGKGVKDATIYDHYSVLKTIEDNFSLGSLGTKDVPVKIIPFIPGTCGGVDPITTTIIPTSTTSSTDITPTSMTSIEVPVSSTAEIPPPPTLGTSATATTSPPTSTITTSFISPTSTTTVTPCAHAICATGVALKRSMRGQDHCCG